MPFAGVAERAAPIEELMRGRDGSRRRCGRAPQAPQTSQMTTWLADASVLLAREEGDDAHHDEARWLLGGPEPVATLDLAYYEVTHVAVRAWRDVEGRSPLRWRSTLDNVGYVKLSLRRTANCPAHARCERG
ncbi:MAG: hypothetical protein AVDCRST_MAG45-2193 [uncultured Solirubrobacterales bacterium]|uniref:PIN domain-containing protein n=1 Tax=uncultured Solirubrobacterales bacterium TaxID=768556 RepID=A0A6J4T865_9ACTN|nr:MAG: hypothetical protein AVDCRST_MAG45-2193 [uncultured Solirubrobacterales bacterium]